MSRFVFGSKRFLASFLFNFYLGKCDMPQHRIRLPFAIRIYLMRYACANDTYEDCCDLCLTLNRRHIRCSGVQNSFRVIYSSIIIRRGEVRMTARLRHLRLTAHVKTLRAFFFGRSAICRSNFRPLPLYFIVLFPSERLRVTAESRGNAGKQRDCAPPPSRGASGACVCTLCKRLSEVSQNCTRILRTCIECRRTHPIRMKRTYKAH